MCKSSQLKVNLKDEQKLAKKENNMNNIWSSQKILNLLNYS
jgi:hypothetical protein